MDEVDVGGLGPSRVRWRLDHRHAPALRVKRVSEFGTALTNILAWRGLTSLETSTAGLGIFFTRAWKTRAVSESPANFTFHHGPGVTRSRLTLSLNTATQTTQNGSIRSPQSLRPARSNSPGSASSFEDKVDSSRTSTAPNAGDDSDNESASDDSDHSVDELQSEDNIVVQPRRSSTRELPQRASRAQVSYARPKKVVKKGKSQSKTKWNKLLQSDTSVPAPKQDSKPAPDTARAKVRQEILEKTKPKRDAFIVAHKDAFQPLLPETSYIDKLERLNAVSDENQLPEFTIYRSPEQQPQGVKAEMKPYQVEGLSFLVYMYNNGMSSILGDEMVPGRERANDWRSSTPLGRMPTERPLLLDLRGTEVGA
ncbi:hypothetical protein KC327_g90 [Hortaea werneckii]|nr:hypothetical protein KC327_g90 [Hortaea werneckii]